MVRYDQVEKVKKVEQEESKDLKKVIIDQEHMEKIMDIFLNNLKNILLKNSTKTVIKSINHEFIIFDDTISLEELSNTLGKKLNSKLEFIKEYYMYKLDDFINEAYNEKVTAIQEYPYSFQVSDKNPNIIKYEFIN